jgi:hypothetical protein
VHYVKGALHYIEGAVHYIKGAVRYVKWAVHYIEGAVHYIKGAVHYIKVNFLKIVVFLTMTPCCLGDGYLLRCHCFENLKYDTILILQIPLLFFLYNLLHYTFFVRSTSLYLFCKA